jgi:hypothetical protein
MGFAPRFDPRLLDCQFHGRGVYVLTIFQERLNSLSDRLLTGAAKGDIRVLDDDLVVHGEDDRIARGLEGEHGVELARQSARAPSRPICPDPGHGLAKSA